MLRIITKNHLIARAILASMPWFVVPGVQSAEVTYPAVDCVIQPYQVADLGSPVSGVIKEILVERSDQVAKGEPVALIEDRVEVATVELAKARAKVDAQIEIEELNINYDLRNQERIDSLYVRKVIAIDPKDDADREAGLSQLRLEQVKDLQEVRSKELKRAKELVEQKIIRSTIDGFVVTRYKSEGEFVEDQPILRIAQLDTLNVEAILPMKYFAMIRPGMLAEVNPEMPGARLRSAQVSVVDRIGDTASGTFGVRLEMDNPGFEIPAGLKCDVKFLETSEEVMAAARQQPPKHSGSSATPVSTAITHYTLGPFTSRPEFLSARDAVAHLDYTDRRETISATRDFQIRSSPDSEDVVRDQIENGHLEDYRALNQSGTPAQYSLGVFSTRARANKRLQDLSALGITAEVKERSSETTQWWIDVIVSADDQSVKLLKEKGIQIQASSLTEAGT